MHAILFSEIVDSLPDGIIAIEENGKIKIANQSACNLFDYQKQELIGQSLSILIPAKYAHHGELVKDYFREPEFRPMGRHKSTMVGLRKDGTEIPVDISLSHLKTQDGKHIAIAAIRDISDRKEKEIALQKVVEQFKVAQKIAKIGSWELNLQNHALEWSDEIYRIFDISKEKFGASYEAFLERVHPEDRELLDKEYTLSVKNKTPYNFEHRIVLPGGRIRYIQEKGKTFYDEEGNPIKTTGTTQDITDRKIAKQALLERENRLRAILNTEPECIKLLDKDARLLEMNPAGLQILEAESDDHLIGQVILPFIDKPFQRPFKALVEKGMKGQSGKLVFRAKTLKGNVRWLETNSVPFKNTKGEIESVLSITRDITERKQAEELLKLKVEELRKVNEEMDHFVYSASHDLRAPLRTMLGLIELIQLETQEAATHEYTEMIRERIGRLDQLVENILNYSKNAREKINLSEIDTRHLISEVTEGFTKEIKDGLLHVESFISPETSSIYSDQERLRLVFHNLISNSVKFRNPERDKVEIFISTQKLNNNILIQFRDNGCGIEPAYHHRVFDLFFRVGKQNTGAGVGLFLVKEMLHRINGRIDLMSEPNKGSTFMITLTPWPNEY